MQINQEQVAAWRENSENSRSIAAGFQNTRIHIDRSVRPNYLPGLHYPVYPEFESRGPTAYDFLIDVMLLPHTEFGDGMYLTATTLVRMLPREVVQNGLCLADALELQKMGIHFFEEFVGKDTFLVFWKSARHGMAQYWMVPILRPSNGRLMIQWVGCNDVIGMNGMSPFFK